MQEVEAKKPETREEAAEVEKPEVKDAAVDEMVRALLNKSVDDMMSIYRCCPLLFPRVCVFLDSFSGNISVVICVVLFDAFRPVSRRLKNCLLFCGRRKRSSEKGEAEAAHDEPATKVAALDGALERQPEATESEPEGRSEPGTRPEEPTPASPKQETSVSLVTRSQLNPSQENSTLLCSSCGLHISL